MGAKKKSPCCTLPCVSVNAKLLLRVITIATLPTKANLRRHSSVENDQCLDTESHEDDVPG